MIRENELKAVIRDNETYIRIDWVRSLLTIPEGQFLILLASNKFRLVVDAQDTTDLYISAADLQEINPPIINSILQIEVHQGE